MKIFELEIPRLRYSQFFKEITHHLTSKKQSRALTVCTPNPEICLKTLEDREFLALLTSSDYLTSDGIGLYLGYQIMDNSHGKLWNILLLPKYIFKILQINFYNISYHGKFIILTSDETSGSRLIEVIFLLLLF